MYFVANNFEVFIYMVYNNKDIYGQLIVDDQKIEQQIYKWKFICL